MKRTLGRVLSVIGNNGFALMFILTSLVCGLETLSGIFDIGYFIALTAMTIGMGVMANIGNKSDDRYATNMKTKYVLFKILSWIPRLLTSLFFLVGFIFVIMAFTGDFNYLWMGVYWIVVGGWVHNNYNYLPYHCACCGCSLYGGGFYYEEVSRENRRSKIRFEFTCPECEGSTIYYKTMKTDQEVVEKYAYSVIGRD